MPSNTLAVFLLAVFCSAAALACDQSPQQKNEQALLDMETRWVHALDNRSIAELDCLLAPEFMDSGVFGELKNRQEVLDALPHRRQNTQHLEDLKATVIGDTGIVRGVNRLTSLTGEVLARVRFTDIFLYRNRRWQAVSGHESLVQEPPKK